MNPFSVSFHDFAPEHGPGTGIQVKFCKKQNERELTDYFVITVGGLMLFMNHERMKEWRDAMKHALHEDSEPRNEALEIAEVRDALEKTRDTLEKERTASEFHIQNLISELRETRAALKKEGQRVDVIRKSEKELAERAKNVGATEVYVSCAGFTRLPEAMRADLDLQGHPAGESGGKVWFFKRLGAWEAWPEPKLEKLLADDEKSRFAPHSIEEALRIELKHVQELLEDAETDLAKERQCISDMVNVIHNALGNEYELRTSLKNILEMNYKQP